VAAEHKLVSLMDAETRELLKAAFLLADAADEEFEKWERWRVAKQRSNPSGLRYRVQEDALVPKNEASPEPDPMELWLQFADMIGSEMGRAVKAESDALRAEIASLRADLEILRGMVGGNVTAIKRERDVA
jgi:hypothetical protein